MSRQHSRCIDADPFRSALEGHSAEQGALTRRLRLLAQIATGISTIPSSVSCRRRNLRSVMSSNRGQVKGRDTALRRGRLIEQLLEDPATDPYGALVRPEDHAELDGVPFLIPVRVLREFEK